MRKKLDETQLNKGNLSEILQGFSETRKELSGDLSEDKPILYNLNKENEDIFQLIEKLKRDKKNNDNNTKISFLKKEFALHYTHIIGSIKKILKENPIDESSARIFWQMRLHEEFNTMKSDLIRMWKDINQVGYDKLNSVIKSLDTVSSIKGLENVSESYFKKRLGTNQIDIPTQIEIEKRFKQECDELVGDQNQVLDYILGTNDLSNYKKLCFLGLYSLDGNKITEEQRSSINNLASEEKLYVDYPRNNFGKKNGIGILRNIALKIGNPNEVTQDEQKMAGAYIKTIIDHGSSNEISAAINSIQDKLREKQRLFISLSGGPSSDLRFNMRDTEENKKIFKEILVEAYKDGIPAIFKRTSNDNHLGIGNSKDKRLLIYVDSKSAQYFIEKIKEKTGKNSNSEVLNKKSKKGKEEKILFPFGEEQGIYIRGSHEAKFSYKSTRSLYRLHDKNS